MPGLNLESKEGDLGEAPAAAADKKMRRVAPEGGGDPKCSSESVNGQQNPLLNSLVMRTVFKYASLEEVKRNRLVCKAWLEASKHQWTKQTKSLTLYRSKKVCSDDGKMVEKLLEMCNSMKGSLKKVIPYRKFIFQLWVFDNALISEIKELDSDAGMLTAEQNLWSRAAPSLITDLTLDNCRFPEEFTVFTAHFLRALPSLVRLTVENILAGPGVIVENPDYLQVVRVNPVENGVAGIPALDFNPIRQEEIAEIAGQYIHRNLKFLQVEASSDQKDLSRRLVRFLSMVPNVETILMRGFDAKASHLFLKLLATSPAARRTIKKLDFIDLSSKALDYGIIGKWGNFNCNLEGLKVLHYDIGYMSEHAGRDMGVIYNRMNVLEELHLYRAPFVKPYPYDQVFKCWRRASSNITELHLWGNMTDSLDLLNFFPNLRVLVWTTSCYEEKYHGQRVYQVIEKSTFPLMECDFVESTKSVCTMVHLVKLEFDWTVKSTESWSKLGAWMPNLTSLKAKVMDEDQLSQIGKQWKHLESFELAHGSQVSAEVVLKQIEKFPKLREFTFLCCLCSERLWNEEDFVKLLELAQKLGIQLYTKQVEPRTPPTQLFQKNYWNSRTRLERKICIQAEYEKMLISCDVREYVKLLFGWVGF